MVKGLELALALNLDQAGIASERLKLIGRGQIGRHGHRMVRTLRQAEGNLDAQMAHMRSPQAATGLGAHGLVNTIGATRRRLDVAAAAADGIELVELNAVLLHKGQDRLLAQVVLRPDVGTACGQRIGIVREGLTNLALIVFEVRDLGARRAQVDG